MRLAERWWQEFLAAARSLRRAPTVTVAAIVTLALGIGATTTIFSMIHAVVLRRLPIAEPDRLFFVAHGTAEPLSTSSHYPWFERVKAERGVFQGVAAYNVRDFKVASDTGVERVFGQYASADYHRVVGARFELGRGFTADDDRKLSPIAVISEGYWIRRFDRSPHAIGSVLTIGGHAVTIVGVTASGFDGLQPGQMIDVTLPLWIYILDNPDFVTATDTWTSMPLVVRLADGVDAELARGVIAGAYRGFMSLPDNVRYSRDQTGRPTEATLESAARGSERLRRGYAQPLFILMGMVAIVLLIACVNVANLLLMQAPSRAREVAVRMALGASRRRIVHQLLSESLLLAIIGGAAGLLLALWGTRFVSMLLASGMRPILIDIQPDGRVLVFTLVVSILTGAAFGMAPAWRTTGVDLVRSLKAGTAWSMGSRGLGQRVMVAAQIAVSLMLVFGAGLLFRTLQNLNGLDTGFRKSAVVLFELDARDTPFPRDRLQALCGQLIERFDARPDVVSGTCSTMSPVATNSEGKIVSVPGFAGGSEPKPIVLSNSVDPAYFATFGIEIGRGRAFTPADAAASMRVAILSQAMAAYYFGNENPIGRTFTFGRSGSPAITVVGVAIDARQDLRNSPPHMAYTPLSQRDEPPSGLLVALRTAGDTAPVAASVRSEVRAVTTDVAVSYVRTMDDQIQAALVGERLLATLSGAFAVLALVLACVGLHGAMSFSVTRRVRDIGIRLALGARRTQILGEVLRQASIVTIAGLGAGAIGAVTASRALTGFLFGLEPRDAVTLIAAVVLLGATALSAGYLPARRAARVDPATTLRIE